MTGDLALETGLFALVLAPEAYLPLRRLGAEFHASEEGLAAARDAFAVLDAAPQAAAGDGAAAVPASLAGIAAEGLSVEGLSVEQPGRLVLAPADVSLVVRAGDVVAVTGASGAGKSTLLATILGFTAPSAGRVSALAADGVRVDLASADPVAWRARIAWVPQVPYLFPGTIAENVRLGSPGATDVEVADALARVGLAGSNATADLVLGERGRGLSGGERRRLGVARALVRHAPILLLDEPTAGLDADAEALVMAAIRAEASRGAAVLLVAHRPGAVAGADRTVEIRWAAVEAAAAAASAAASAATEAAS
jgi:ABC-type transport system involved in cytochrome bd biosynthesis fused ATPase/permease subunit